MLKERLIILLTMSSLLFCSCNANNKTDSDASEKDQTIPEDVVEKEEITFHVSTSYGTKYREVKEVVVGEPLSEYFVIKENSSGKGEFNGYTSIPVSYSINGTKLKASKINHYNDSIKEIDVEFKDIKKVDINDFIDCEYYNLQGEKISTFANGVLSISILNHVFEMSDFRLDIGPEIYCNSFKVDGAEVVFREKHNHPNIFYGFNKELYLDENGSNGISSKTNVLSNFAAMYGPMAYFDENNIQYSIKDIYLTTPNHMSIDYDL